MREVGPDQVGLGFKRFFFIRLHFIRSGWITWVRLGFKPDARLHFGISLGDGGLGILGLADVSCEIVEHWS